MGRRVATAGLVLVAAGITLLATTQPPVQVAPSLPIDRALNVGLSLLPLIGLLGTWIGSITLGLALLIRITGRDVLDRPVASLLWGGLGLVVLSRVLEAVVLSSLGDGATLLQQLIVPGAAAVQVVGATLVACWLTGWITGAGEARAHETGQVGSVRGADRSRPRR